MRYFLITLSAGIFILAGCQNAEKNEGAMEEKIAKFARTDINYDASLLDDRQKMVVEKLYYASKIIDEIFLEQVYSRNFEIRDSLRESNDSKATLKLEYFDIMFGPFDRIDENKPFIGTAPKPTGANFYPEDMTKAEFENWLTSHPEDRKSFTSEFTVIRRQNGNLIAVPYSTY